MRILLSFIFGLVLLGSSYAGIEERDWKHPTACWWGSPEDPGVFCCSYNDDGGDYCDSADGPG